MKWLAPAKINLSLRVLGRREDGFHELETLMLPLSLADELTIETKDASKATDSARHELVCSDPSLPVDLDNLVLRAVKVFEERTSIKLPPLRLELLKKIPHGAGLGGGSSDAATALIALNEIFHARLSVPQLAAMAAELGSDVPFFVHRSAAICRGRGELVEPIELPHQIPLLLLKPDFPVPTPWAYQRWAVSREIPGVSYAAQNFTWGTLVNDLERPVFEKYLLLAEIKMWLLEQSGVAGAMMSGSGSTMIATLHSEKSAGHLAQAARERFGDLWTCSCLNAPS